MAATGGEPTRFPLVFLGLLAGTAAVGLRLGCTGATAGLIALKLKQSGS